MRNSQRDSCVDRQPRFSQQNVCPTACKQPNQGSSVTSHCTGVSGDHQNLVKCDNSRAATDRCNFKPRHTGQSHSVAFWQHDTANCSSSPESVCAALSSATLQLLDIIHEEEKDWDHQTVLERIRDGFGEHIPDDVSSKRGLVLHCWQSHCSEIGTWRSTTKPPLADIADTELLEKVKKIL
ncbi:uncharacterized protein LOC116052868 isoform X3 [Sander lucioperca]|uniref:uncharacterized protein LOC116052868 isoform X3 n=1 Tax=Sander lucioperca TaxID=283035 RepID=UPI001653D9C1|nr:uncharacterized protein LOC116052868 isoform X3 [Sander lucioperca]